MWLRRNHQLRISIRFLIHLKIFFVKYFHREREIFVSVTFQEFLFASPKNFICLSWTSPVQLNYILHSNSETRKLVSKKDVLKIRINEVGLITWVAFHFPIYTTPFGQVRWDICQVRHVNTSVFWKVAIIYIRFLSLLFLFIETLLAYGNMICSISGMD